MNLFRTITVAAGLALVAPATMGQNMTTHRSSHTSTHNSTQISSSTNVSSSTTVTSSTSSGSNARSSTRGIRNDADYIAGIAPRFERFAGSHQNLESLVSGMRTGSQITLVGRSGTETVVFSPPLRRMSYADITQALELAKQELAGIGIAQPAPHALMAALNGGTIVTSNGETTLAGILQNRSRGMSWGRIAHLSGVHSTTANAGSNGNASVSSSGVSAGNASVTFGPGGMRVQAGNGTR